MSTIARRLRPISRWISWVRPVCLPRAASRAERVWVERGNMPYSAVIQPVPLLRRKCGTPFSMVAVHSTLVSPNSTSTEPSAWRVKWRVKRISRNWFGARPLGRIVSPSLSSQASQRRTAAEVLSL